MSVAPHPHFSGWRVCGAAVLTQAVAIGFTLGSVGVFAAPLAAEFGATATEFNLAVSLFSLMMNLSMPLIGRFLDRGSIRRVMVVGAVVLALSLGLMSQATALWQIGLLFGVGCAVGMAMLGPMSSSTAMANWFDRFRGRALGIANAGAPAGPALIAPAAAFAITTVGWRPTLLGFAVVTLCVGLPTIAFGMIDRPRDVGQLPDGGGGGAQAAGRAETDAEPTPWVAASIPAEPWDSGSILRCRDFWLLALAAAPFGATGIVMGANAIPFMMHEGASAESASVVVILQSLGAVTGPLVFGSLADRIHPRLLFIGLIVTLCLGLAGLMLRPGYLPSLGLFTIVGVVGGSMMPVYGALIGRLFGPLAFGQVMGLGALLGMPVIFLAPLGFGFAFDATGAYTLGMGALSVTLLIAAVLFGLLPNGAARRADQRISSDG